MQEVSKRFKPQGETGKRLAQARKKSGSSSDYRKWKRRLPFWPRKAMIIILFGSMITAPVRTLRHALPAYVAILGARPGLIMAVSAQVLRTLFLLLCTCILMIWWL